MNGKGSREQPVGEESSLDIPRQLAGLLDLHPENISLPALLDPRGPRPRTTPRRPRAGSNRPSFGPSPVSDQHGKPLKPFPGRGRIDLAVAGEDQQRSRAGPTALHDRLQQKLLAGRANKHPHRAELLGFRHQRVVQAQYAQLSGPITIRRIATSNLLLESRQQQ